MKTEKTWINRNIESHLHHHLKRGKSILLLGPRQTGKTSLLEKIPTDLSISFLSTRIRQEYEKNPSLLRHTLDSFRLQKGKLPLVLIDEVQKIPDIMNEVQFLIDHHKAQFILTGSSARKLKHSSDPNLLPGRVVLLKLDPLNLQEIPDMNLDEVLEYGSLPGIYLEPNLDNREEDLRSYVETYLEEEIRNESVVRNLSHFARFIEFACLDAGKLVSFREISQEIGISHTTVAGYYQILLDCLLMERIDPITRSTSRKKLSKSSRYLFFDLGVRRIGANENTRPGLSRKGEWFEQWVGLECIRRARYHTPRCKVGFWRDPNGPEVDYVLQFGNRWVPIEVKWATHPKPKDASHIETFVSEYPEAKKGGFVVCRTERQFKLSPNVTAIPWQEIGSLFD